MKEDASDSGLRGQQPALHIVRVEWLGFRIPFVRPFAAGHGTLEVRAGILLRIITREGLSGVGEASPLPSYDGGHLVSTLGTIQAVGRRLIGGTMTTATRLLSTLDLRVPGATAAACAVETALCDLQAQAQGTPLAVLLNPAAPRSVPVNATVGIAEPEAAAAGSAAAVAEGVDCVKLKAGMAATAQEELERVALVRQAMGPHARLRLDANGAWDVATALEVLRGVEHLDIEFVEQPVRPGDVQGMARIRTQVSVPVAADEAAPDLEGARRVIEAGAADLLVIKPMTAGGLRMGRRMIALAQQAGLGAIVTTTLDAGIGVAAALHLAAALPAPIRHCGLATASLLESSLLVQPPRISGGAMWLPDSAGLGVMLDDEALARYGDGWHELRR